MENKWITNIWVAALLAWTPRLATAVLSSPAQEGRTRGIAPSWSGPAPERSRPEFQKSLSRGIELIGKTSAKAPSFIGKRARLGASFVVRPKSAPAAAPAAAELIGDKPEEIQAAAAQTPVEDLRTMPAPAIAVSLRTGKAFRSLNAELSALQQYDESGGAIEASQVQPDFIRAE